LSLQLTKGVNSKASKVLAIFKYLGQHSIIFRLPVIYDIAYKYMDITNILFIYNFY